jgi:enterochelin esterase-like enzyme
MHTPPLRQGWAVRWLRVIASLALAVVCGCGGGGGDSGSTMQGSTESRSIASHVNGTTYPLSIYLPPASAGPRATLLVVYALDGDWWFQQLVTIAEATHARVIVVGIGNNANRAVDYVPTNTCTPGGGGNVAYLQFIRSELIPYIESTVGGDPTRRALLGHSHGGSFVYYALFAEAAAGHTFSAYLASDSSIGCMPATADEWEAAYATANTELPVRLHMSHTTINNFDVAFDQRIRDRHYGHLVASEQAYVGTHTGIIPAAFADALGFAFAP